MARPFTPPPTPLNGTAITRRNLILRLPLSIILYLVEVFFFCGFPKEHLNKEVSLDKELRSLEVYNYIDEGLDIAIRLLFNSRF